MDEPRYEIVLCGRADATGAGGRAGGNQRLAEDGQIANDFIVEISGRQTDRQTGRPAWMEGRERGQRGRFHNDLPESVSQDSGREEDVFCEESRLTSPNMAKHEKYPSLSPPSASLPSLPPDIYLAICKYKPLTLWAEVKFLPFRRPLDFEVIYPSCNRVQKSHEKKLPAYNPRKIMRTPKWLAWQHVWSNAGVVWMLMIMNVLGGHE